MVAKRCFLVREKQKKELNKMFSFFVEMVEVRVRVHVRVCCNYSPLFLSNPAPLGIEAPTIFYL